MTTPDTLARIFETEGELSPAHINSIRRELPPNSTALDYLQVLLMEAELSRHAMSMLKAKN